MQFHDTHVTRVGRPRLPTVNEMDAKKCAQTLNISERSGIESTGTLPRIMNTEMQPLSARIAALTRVKTTSCRVWPSQQGHRARPILSMPLEATAEQVGIPEVDDYESAVQIVGAASPHGGLRRQTRIALAPGVSGSRTHSQLAGRFEWTYRVALRSLGARVREPASFGLGRFR